MTLPTSRQRPWIFPGQREHMTSLHSTVYEAPLHHPELMPSTDSWSSSKREAERHRVFSALRDNHKKDRYYVANPNKNWGDNELHKLSHVHDHPEHLHGGVMTSKAGQQWAFNRLKERVDELNIRASAAFGTEANMAQPSKLPGKTGTEDAIDSAFTALYDSVQAVEFANAVTNAQKVLTTLYEGGDTLGTNTIKTYLDSSADIKRDLIALLDIPTDYARDSYGVGANRDKRTIKTVLPIMDRIIRLLDLIAKTANRSQPERKQAISSSRGRDLAEARTRFGQTDFAQSPAIYQSGLPAPGVPGENPPGTTPFTATQQGFQGQRNLGEDSMSPEQAKRYSSSNFEPGLSSGENSPLPLHLSPEESPAPSPPPSSPVVPRTLQRFKIKKPTGSGMTDEEMFQKWARNYVKVNGRKPSLEEQNVIRGNISMGIPLQGGCGSCDEGMSGYGVGDGPINSVHPSVLFFNTYGRNATSEQELMDFMKAVNQTSKVEVTDPMFENTGKGRHHDKDARARQERLRGRGKPKDCQASHMLEELNRLGDNVGLHGSGKKKNSSERHR